MQTPVYHIEITCNNIKEVIFQYSMPPEANAKSVIKINFLLEFQRRL